MFKKTYVKKKNNNRRISREFSGYLGVVETLHYYAFYN